MTRLHRPLHIGFRIIAAYVSGDSRRQYAVEKIALFGAVFFCMFVFTPTDDSLDTQQYDLCDELAILVCRCKGVDNVEAARDFNPQVGKSSDSEASLDERCGLYAQRTEQEGRLL